MTGTQGVEEWRDTSPGPYCCFIGKMCSALPAAMLGLQPTCLPLGLLFKVGSLGALNCRHPLYPGEP